MRSIGKRAVVGAIRYSPGAALFGLLRRETRRESRAALRRHGRILAYMLVLVITGFSVWAVLNHEGQEQQLTELAISLTRTIAER